MDGDVVPLPGFHDGGGVEIDVEDVGGGPVFEGERLRLGGEGELEFIDVAAVAVAVADVEEEVLVGVAGALEPCGEGPVVVGEIQGGRVDLAREFGGAEVARGDSQRLHAAGAEGGGFVGLAGERGDAADAGGCVAVVGGLVLDDAAGERVGLFVIVVKNETLVRKLAAGGEGEVAFAGDVGGWGEARGFTIGQDDGAAVVRSGDAVIQVGGGGFRVGDAGGEIDVDGCGAGCGDGRAGERSGAIVRAFGPVLVVPEQVAVLAEDPHVAHLVLAGPWGFVERPGFVIDGIVVNFSAEAVGDIEHGAVAGGVDHPRDGVVDMGEIRRVEVDVRLEGGEAGGGGGLRVFVERGALDGIAAFVAEGLGGGRPSEVADVAAGDGDDHLAVVKEEAAGGGGLVDDGGDVGGNGVVGVLPRPGGGNVENAGDGAVVLDDVLVGAEAAAGAPAVAGGGLHRQAGGAGFIPEDGPALGGPVVGRNATVVEVLDLEGAVGVERGVGF